LIKRLRILFSSYFLNHPLYLKVLNFLDKSKPLGFKGNSLKSVGEFFINAMRSEDIHLRASSLAYSFFLSIFPLLLFLLTLIAYVPVDDLKNEVITSLELVLPKTTFKAINTTVKDILKNQRGGLLSIGLFAAIYFSSNGMLTLINALNRGASAIKKKNVFQKRGLAIALTLGLIVLLISTATLLVYLDLTESLLLKQKYVPNLLINISFLLLQILILMSMLFLSISSIYFFGTRNSQTFRFISPGSIVATFLIIITTFIMQYYLNNILSYNKIYGSIGAIIALLIVLYFNSNCILIGHELNKSIDKAIDAKIQSRPFVLKNIEKK